MSRCDHAARPGSQPGAAVSDFLNPFGQLLGLDGVILLAYIIAILANEIVVPTMLMVYLATGMMTDVPSNDQLRHVLVNQHGWTMLTAVCLMLFSLLHNPCGRAFISRRYSWKPEFVQMLETTST